MLGFIWIQAVCHSDGIPESFFFKYDIETYQQATKNMQITQ